VRPPVPRPTDGDKLRKRATPERVLTSWSGFDQYYFRPPWEPGDRGGLLWPLLELGASYKVVRELATGIADFGNDLFWRSSRLEGAERLAHLVVANICEDKSSYTIDAVARGKGWETIKYAKISFELELIKADARKLLPAAAGPAAAQRC
jgi:hypothetical protein